MVNAVRSRSFRNPLEIDLSFCGRSLDNMISTKLILGRTETKSYNLAGVSIYLRLKFWMHNISFNLILDFIKQLS